MRVRPSRREELLAAILTLRAFAIALIHRRNRADDLVQGTRHPPHLSVALMLIEVP
jgi:DNA-directed RNA polymerase specialized sigma24 family protein